MTDEELLAVVATPLHGWPQSKDAAMRELLSRNVDLGLLADAIDKGTMRECPHGRSLWDFCETCDPTEDDDEAG